MGAKASGCQASLCFKEAKFRCSCSGVKLCADCFDLHKREKPQLNHRPTPLDLADHNPAPQPTAFSMANLELLRVLYRSPDDSTIVHEAKVKGMDGLFAVKCMTCRTEQDYKKKLQEATLQQSLKHPNICSCIAHFLNEEYRSGYQFVMVLEYSEKGDVEEDTVVRRLRNAPYSEKDLRKHMAELIDAFAYLQDRSLIHGDIKPKNIFIANNGLLKIGDFGESRQGLQLLAIQTTQIRGTIAYFSPLLFQAYIDTFKGKNVNGDVRHNAVKSDVFSLGLTFLHMALLSKPLELNNLEIGQQALQKEIYMTVMRLRYGKEVKQILNSMLMVQESKRYDFKQLRNLLNELFPSRESGLFDPFSISREVSQEEEAQESPKVLPLIAVSNCFSKAFICHPGSRQTTSLISQKFQPSCKCCFVSPGTIIITGGAKKPTGVFEMMAETQAVSAKADLNEGRLWHSICYLDGEVYVMAGRTPSKDAMNSVEVLRKGSWQLLAPLNTPRDSATAVVHNGRILVAGGATNRAGKWELLDSIEQMENDKWTTLNIVLPHKAGGVGLLSISSSNLLITGGYMNRGAFSDKAWSLDTESGEVQEFPALPEEGSFSSMTSAIAEGRYVFLSTLTGLFEYDPSTRQWDVARYLVKT